MKKSRSDESEPQSWPDEAMASHRREEHTTTYVYRAWVRLLPKLAIWSVVFVILYAGIMVWGWAYQASKAEESQPYTKGVLYDIAYELGRGWQTGVNDAIQKDE